jgi:MFS family permease
MLEPLNPSAASSPFRSLSHEVALCLTIFCSQLFTQASLGNVIVPLHIIADDLGVTQDAKGERQMPWFIAAYSLTVGAFMMVTGRLGDVYGHKRVYVFGMLWYGLCTLLLGFTTYVKSVELFVLLRACQGIGPALTLPNGVALLAHAYPPGQRKAFVFAAFGASAPLGFVTGAAVGSVFAQLLWWPWAQWILGALCLVVAAVAASSVIPPTPERGPSDANQVDVLGAVVVVLGLVAIVFACNQGPIDGWDVPYVYLSLIIGFGLIGLFVYIESRTTFPIMPLDVWTQPGFPGVISCMMFGWASFGVWNFYAVQLMEVQRGSTPLATSAQVVPLLLLGVCATLVMWTLHHRVKSQSLLCAAMCAFCAGNVLIALCPVDSSYWTYLFASMCITPFGMDLSYPAASLIVSNALPSERQGVGASMINAAVNLSVSIGLGLAGTVERYVHDEATHAGGTGSMHGPHSALYVGIGLAGMGILIALFFTRVPEPSLKIDDDIDASAYPHHEDRYHATEMSFDSSMSMEG